MRELEYAEKIKEAAKAAGDIMLNATGAKVMEKSGHANFCTETDEKIQEFLIGKMKEIIEDAQFLGEEDGQDVFTEKMRSGYVFVIDPIDGTSNFIFGYRPSVISIALLKDGKPVVGVVYNPFSREMYSAVKGEGAYLNGERFMSDTAPLSESLAVFGTAPYYEELRNMTMEMATKLLPQCVDIRRSGTAAWDMCCVASGRCAIYFELRVQIWDYAAAALIAEEAGCTLTDAKGEPLSYCGQTSAICRSRGVESIPDCLLMK
ncbi:MAG: inositol monophosphatase [Lachnospiraceae bacterium]|nr:inositol monophosphatase [Lachnospiraceae bacterium]